MSERAVGICAELIRRRLIPRDELVELEDDPGLRDEVSHRLSEVGLILLDRPGVPYLGVAMAHSYRAGDNLADYGMNSRALGLLLYLWLQLIAPIIYGEESQPQGQGPLRVSKEALLTELPGGWSKTLLDTYLGTLRKRHFIENVTGANQVQAGPMLWLAIDHDQLRQFLRQEKGLPKAIERYLSQTRAETDEMTDASSIP